MLYKVFVGSKEELSKVAVHEGYAYFLTDDSEPVGEWLVDANGVRQEVYSAGLVDANERLAASQVRSKSFAIVVKADAWANGKNTVTVEGLTCGSDGTVPPIVAPADGCDKSEWSKIDSANASKGSITFEAASVPTKDLALIVVDNR